MITFPLILMLKPLRINQLSFLFVRPARSRTLLELGAIDDVVRSKTDGSMVLDLMTTDTFFGLNMVTSSTLLCTLTLECYELGIWEDSSSDGQAAFHLFMQGARKYPKL